MSHTPTQSRQAVYKMVQYLMRQRDFHRMMSLVVAWPGATDSSPTRWVQATQAPEVLEEATWVALEISLGEAVAYVGPFVGI